MNQSAAGESSKEVRAAQQVGPSARHVTTHDGFNFLLFHCEDGDRKRLGHLSPRTNLVLKSV